MTDLHVDDWDSRTGRRDPREDDLDAMRERMKQQPEIDTKSNELAAQAGLPSEGDRRDKVESDASSDERQRQEA